MTAHYGLRLLPWTTPDGNPCYLNTDDTDSHLSRLADRLEDEQLDLASDLVDLASGVLNDKDADPNELHALARSLVGALRDVLRVAESRGDRLADPAVTPRGQRLGGPRLLAASSG
ncbi:hypothetical protein AB0E83_17680 [Streptomyces sp. NPDC035033]|uniref:hypothetical protein n=1 Tax=Streptomyces sp. NPDC035033 TaxID=3155368 RepID=UPI0033C5D9D1